MNAIRTGFAKEVARLAEYVKLTKRGGMFSSMKRGTVLMSHVDSDQAVMEDLQSKLEIKTPDRTKKPKFF